MVCANHTTVQDHGYNSIKKGELHWDGCPPFTDSMKQNSPHLPAAGLGPGMERQKAGKVQALDVWSLGGETIQHNTLYLDEMHVREERSAQVSRGKEEVRGW